MNSLYKTILFIFCLLTVINLSGCNNTTSIVSSEQEIFTIDENYMDNITELQTNFDLYENKPIKIVGYFHKYIDEQGIKYYSIIRYFENEHTHENVHEHECAVHEEQIPVGIELDIEDFDHIIGNWVCAEGILSRYIENDIYYLYLYDVKISTIDT